MIPIELRPSIEKDVLDKPSVEKLSAWINKAHHAILVLLKQVEDQTHYIRKLEKLALTDEELIAKARQLVSSFFKGDEYKTALWFKVENPLLGNFSPENMIKLGRIRKLLQFIETSLDGEGP